MWALGVELFEVLIDSSLPKPVELLKALKELDDVVLGALDGTSKKQDDLNDLLILGDPVIEWLSLVLWLILLVPVLDILGGLEYVTSSSVDSTLDFLKGWLQSAGISLKMNINLKEWLKDLFWHVSSSTDSLLHLIKRILGGVKKSLIHGPIVIFRKLLDFLS